MLRPAAWLVGDQPALVAGRAVLVVVAVVGAALLFRVARNLGLSRTGAAVVVGIWSLSPLVVFYGRQVLLDNVASVWLLASLATATGSGRRRALVSGACFGVAVLSKETALLAGPGVLVALCASGGGHRKAPGGGRGVAAGVDRPRASGAGHWLAAAGLVVGGWLAWVAASGDLLPLLGAVEWQLHGRGGTGSVVDPDSTTYRTVASWWARDPYLLSFRAVATAVGLAWRETRGVALVPVALAAAGLRPGGYLPAMHVIMALPAFALLIGYAVGRVWRAAGRLSGRRAVEARVAVAGLAAVAALAAAPAWAGGARAALVEDANAAYRQALAYAAVHLPRDTVVLTDDVTWNDLVRLGWSDDGWDGPVWHFKLDRDPEAATRLPDGWRDVDYILAGPAMRAMLGTPAISDEQAPQVVTAWRHSTVVAAWGPPHARVELRRVDPPDADRPREPGDARAAR